MAVGYNCRCSQPQQDNFEDSNNEKCNNQRYVEKTKKIRQLMISFTFQAHSNKFFVQSVDLTFENLRQCRLEAVYHTVHTIHYYYYYYYQIFDRAIPTGLRPSYRVP